MKGRVYHILYRTKLNEFLGFSELAFEKFALSVEKNVLWGKDLKAYQNYFNKLNSTNGINLSYLVIKYLTWSIVLVTYSLFNYLLSRIKRPKHNNDSNIKFVIIAAKTRLSMFSSNPHFKSVSLTYYLPNLKFRNSGSKKRTLQLPLFGLRFLVSIIRFYFKKANTLLKELKKQGINNRDTLIVFERTMKIIIYQYIAKTSGSCLLKKHPNSIFIFQNDFSGLLLCLVDYYKKKSKITVHIQHGYYVNTDFEYSPLLSDYMLCCSAREKEIQIQKKVNSERLITYGAPYQILVDIDKIKHKEQKIKYDVLVLGDNGSDWKQERDFRFLHPLKDLVNIKLLVRAHPKNTDINRMKWNSITDYQVNSNFKQRGLVQDISESTIIISFSVDALISCLTIYKKVIYCANITGNKAFEFLNELPNVSVVENNEQLETAIHYMRNLNLQPFDKVAYKEFLQKNFGYYDIKIIHLNFYNSLQSIYRESFPKS